MEETAQLVPPRNAFGGATVPSPPQPPLSLFAPSGLGSENGKMAGQ
ncbi:MAG: hypothetical protein HYW48_02775 [Deltaproteobacteria bacterium]|nr:hypothetical protein [Deltaproteobacteria bacterium]